MQRKITVNILKTDHGTKNKNIETANHSNQPIHYQGVVYKNLISLYIQVNGETLFLFLKCNKIFSVNNRQLRAFEEQSACSEFLDNHRIGKARLLYGLSSISENFWRKSHHLQLIVPSSPRPRCINEGMNVADCVVKIEVCYQAGSVRQPDLN